MTTSHYFKNLLILLFITCLNTHSMELSKKIELNNLYSLPDEMLTQVVLCLIDSTNVHSPVQLHQLLTIRGVDKRFSMLLTDPWVHKEIGNVLCNNILRDPKVVDFVYKISQSSLDSQSCFGKNFYHNLHNLMKHKEADASILLKLALSKKSKHASTNNATILETLQILTLFFKAGALNQEPLIKEAALKEITPFLAHYIESVSHKEGLKEISYETKIMLHWLLTYANTHNIILKDNDKDIFKQSALVKLLRRPNADVLHKEINKFKGQGMPLAVLEQDSMGFNAVSLAIINHTTEVLDHLVALKVSFSADSHQVKDFLKLSLKHNNNYAFAKLISQLEKPLIFNKDFKKLLKNLAFIWITIDNGNVEPLKGLIKRGLNIKEALAFNETIFSLSKQLKNPTKMNYLQQILGHTTK